MAENPTHLMQSAKDTIQANLPEVAREILAWQGSGVLTNGWLRRAARILEPLSTHDALGLAEKLAKDAALAVVADNPLPERIS